MKNYGLEDLEQIEQVSVLYVGTGFYIYISCLDKLRAKPLRPANGLRKNFAHDLPKKRM